MNVDKYDNKGISKVILFKEIHLRALDIVGFGSLALLNFIHMTRIGAMIMKISLYLLNFP